MRGDVAIQIKALGASSVVVTRGSNVIPQIGHYPRVHREGVDDAPPPLQAAPLSRIASSCAEAQSEFHNDCQPYTRSTRF